MKKILFVSLAALAFAGCIKDDNECKYDECAAKANPAEIKSVQDYLAASGITAVQHCSGIFYAIDQQGSGKKPDGCGEILLNYKGMLTNGNVFDSTKSGQPASFPLSGTVTGFRDGLMQLRVGGKMRLYIPPSLGYGSQAQGPIPANSILVFNIELLDAK